MFIFPLQLYDLPFVYDMVRHGIFTIIGAIKLNVVEDKRLWKCGGVWLVVIHCRFVWILLDNKKKLFHNSDKLVKQLLLCWVILLRFSCLVI